MNEIRIINVYNYRILYINNAKNITSIHTYVKTGSVYELEEEAGISHLLEHIITDSWQKCKGNCTYYWSKKGININARTYGFQTEYYITGLTKEMEDMIDYMSSIITDPVYDERCIERSKKAVKDELLHKINNPYWKLRNLLYKSYVDDTEYGGYSRILDYELNIDNLNKMDKRAISNYYNKWYRPDNMFFMVITDESLINVSKYFEKYLHRRELLNMKQVVPNISIKTRYSLINRTESKKTSFMIVYLNNKPKIEDYIYNDLIKDVLTGDTSSLMYRVLRDKLNLIYSINLSYDINKSHILSIFEVNCQFENGDKLIYNFGKVIKNFVEGKYEQYLLKRSKERMSIVDMNICKDNTEYLSTFYGGQYNILDRIIMTPEIYMDKINKITKERLMPIIKRLFQTRKMVVVCETK